MARQTDRWGFAILGPGDSLQGDGYKFTDADRRLMDRLLNYAAELHRHTGDSGTDRTPTVGPTLALLTAGGAIASGTRFYYRYTIVDGDGNESAPSPALFIDTPLAIANPTGPAVAFTTGSGTLEPGGYSYVLSAYKGSSSLETKASASAFITVTGSNPANSITLTLPARPPGADGYNVYRRTPTGLHYLYLATVVAPAPLAVWTDDGSIAGDCDRSLPANNRTTNTNAIEISFPGATPTLPDGFSWRIYRTADPSTWGRSFLTNLVPTGSPATTALDFVDVGGATQVGGPPSKAQIINAPPKINLTDGAEVQGTLPPGLNVVPTVITFTKAGTLTPEEGTFIWVCDFDRADIIGCRAYLGRASRPAATDVIVDVNAFRPGEATPTWQSIYANGPTRPRVVVGESLGDRTVPVVRHLTQGDALSVDIDQAGGGATPTDHDLTVNIFMMVQGGSTTISQTWPE